MIVPLPHPIHFSYRQRRKEANIKSNKALTALLWLVVLLAAVVFTLRGPLRARGTYVNDFAAPYTSARLWLHHQNPYDPAAFWPAWHNAGAPLGPVYNNPSSTHSVYPPPAVVVLTPFALLPWPLACKALIGISTALYLTALILLSRLLPGTWTQPCKPAFLTIGLLFAPTQSALHVSNVSALAATLALLAIYLLLQATNSVAPRPDSGTWVLPLSTSFAAAALLSLSLCIKPTLAPIILLYLLYRRLWRTLTTTLTLTAIATAIFLFLQPNWNWLPSLRSNIAFLFKDGVASLAEQNLTRSDRIDLQLPAYTLTHSNNAAIAIAALVTITLLGLWLKSANDHTHYEDHPNQKLDRHLLLLSTLLTIGLLPFYQRFYSAIVLLIPALWALRNLAQTRARWILALCCLFLTNTTVLPRILGLHLPTSGLTHRFADTFITAHLCWLLLLLALLLLKALYTSRSDRLPSIQ